MLACAAPRNNPYNDTNHGSAGSQMVRLRPSENRFSNSKAPSDSTPEIGNVPLPREQMLRQLFGLTAAEARLARLMARGEAVGDIATKLGIKTPTARTQLAAVFAKTKTKRQTQLIALLVHIAHLGP